MWDRGDCCELLVRLLISITGRHCSTPAMEMLPLRFLVVLGCLGLAALTDGLRWNVDTPRGVELTVSLNNYFHDFLAPARPLPSVGDASAGPVCRARLPSETVLVSERLAVAPLWAMNDVNVVLTHVDDGGASDFFAGPTQVNEEASIDEGHSWAAGNIFTFRQTKRTRSALAIVGDVVEPGAPHVANSLQYAIGSPFACLTMDVYCTVTETVPVIVNATMCVNVIDSGSAVSSGVVLVPHGEGAEYTLPGSALKGLVRDEDDPSAAAIEISLWHGAAFTRPPPLAAASECASYNWVCGNLLSTPPNGLTGSGDAFDEDYGEYYEHVAEGSCTLNTTALGPCTATLFFNASSQGDYSGTQHFGVLLASPQPRAAVTSPGALFVPNTTHTVTQAPATIAIRAFCPSQRCEDTMYVVADCHTRDSALSTTVETITFAVNYNDLADTTFEGTLKIRSAPLTCVLRVSDAVPILSVVQVELETVRSCSCPSSVPLTFATTAPVVSFDIASESWNTKDESGKTLDALTLIDVDWRKHQRGVVLLPRGTATALKASCDGGHWTAGAPRWTFGHSATATDGLRRACLFHALYRRCMEPGDAIDVIEHIALALFGSAAVDVASSAPSLSEDDWRQLRSEINEARPTLNWISASGAVLCAEPVELRWDSPQPAVATRPQVHCTLTLSESREVTQLAIQYQTSFTPFACRRDGDEIGMGPSAVDVVLQELLGISAVPSGDQLATALGAPNENVGDQRNRLLQRWSTWVLRDVHPSLDVYIAPPVTTALAATMTYTTTPILQIPMATVQRNTALPLFARNDTSSATFVAQLAALASVTVEARGGFANGAYLLFSNRTHDVRIALRRKVEVDALPDVSVGGAACAFNFGFPPQSDAFHPLGESRVDILLANYSSPVWIPFTLSLAFASATSSDRPQRRLSTRLVAVKLPTYGRLVVRDPRDRTFRMPSNVWLDDYDMPLQHSYHCAVIQYIPPAAVEGIAAKDELVFAADDGSGVMSNAVMVTVTLPPPSSAAITTSVAAPTTSSPMGGHAGKLEPTAAQNSSGSSGSSHHYILFIDVIVAVAIVAAIVWRRRRHNAAEFHHVAAAAEHDSDGGEELPAVRAETAVTMPPAVMAEDEAAEETKCQRRAQHHARAV
jgi:hypothetical protein